MNILMMTSWYTDKDHVAGSFVYELAEHLNRVDGIHTAIYFPFDKYIDTPFTAAREGELMVYRSLFQTERKVKNRITIYQTLNKIKKEFHPDIIHVHAGGGCGTFAAVWGKFTGIPYIVTEHLPVEMWGDRKRSYGIFKFVYAHSQYNACVSGDLTKKLSIRYPDIPFHTIHNGVENGYGKKTELYKKDGYINIVIIAGFYSKHIKGFEYLFPAIKEILNRSFPVMLHVVGGGTYEEDYKALAHELGIHNNCIFYGQCERETVNHILSEMDFFVSASIVESFGCAIAEAMMMGLPVIVTDSGGPETYVTDACGIIVKRESTDALVTGITSMISQFHSYNHEEIHKYANDLFGFDTICKKYHQIYHKIL